MSEYTKSKMMFPINDRFRVVSDGDRNFILEEYKYIEPKRKDFQARHDWVFEGYYPTIQSATLACMQRVTVQSEKQSVREILNELDALRNDIIKATKKWG